MIEKTSRKVERKLETYRDGILYVKQLYWIDMIKNEKSCKLIFALYITIN